MEQMDVEQMGCPPATTTPPGRWHLQIRFNDDWRSIYENSSEMTYATKERAWEVARRCYPDTEHLTLMFRVVFYPDDPGGVQ